MSIRPRWRILWQRLEDLDSARKPLPADRSSAWPWHCSSSRTSAPRSTSYSHPLTERKRPTRSGAQLRHPPGVLAAAECSRTHRRSRCHRFRPLGDDRPRRVTLQPFVQSPSGHSAPRAPPFSPEAELPVRHVRRHSFLSRRGHRHASFQAHCGTHAAVGCVRIARDRHAADDDVAALRAELQTLKVRLRRRESRRSNRALHSWRPPPQRRRNSAVSSGAAARDGERLAFNPAISVVLAGNYADTSRGSRDWAAGRLHAERRRSRSRRCAASALGESELTVRWRASIQYFSAYS